MGTLTIEVNAECTGADLKETFTFEIKGSEPTEEEVKEIEEEASVQAIDGLCFSYSWEIKAEAGKI